MPTWRRNIDSYIPTRTVVHYALQVMLLYCNSSFSALTLLVGSTHLTRKPRPVPDMTYNVFGATLNLTQS